ncbi:MAG: carbohydrate ABC transporter permease [Lentisphaerae bacterium]|nr:carbohydrate ABC transporter permease [Lentisphaerota bacterium]
MSLRFTSAGSPVLARRLRIGLVYLFLTALGVTMAFPFFWMVTTAFKDPAMVFVEPPQWWPRPWKWDNFARAWEAVPFGRAYLNTVVVTLSVTAGQVLTSSLAAFAFARLEFPGRDKLFLGYLATMMIPGSVTMIPVFIMTSKLPAILDWLISPEAHLFSRNLYLLGEYYVGRPVGLDSYFALIVPGMFSAYGTFMLRQFFMSIPKDYEDAARIDGCSLLGVYWRVILPLSLPALATLGIFTFLGSWRSYLWPLIVCYREDVMTLPILIRSFQGMYSTEWTLLMAASVLDILPILLVFIVGQRYFMKGINLGGIKG